MKTEEETERQVDEELGDAIISETEEGYSLGINFVTNTAKMIDCEDPSLKHMHVHRQVKHECHICGKFFMWRGRLVNHMQMHGDSLPYYCDECGKGFCYKGHLDRHTANCPSRKVISKPSKMSSAWKQYFAEKDALQKQMLTPTPKKNSKGTVLQDAEGCLEDKVPSKSDHLRSLWKIYFEGKNTLEDSMFKYSFSNSTLEPKLENQNCLEYDFGYFNLWRLEDLEKLT